MIRTSESQGVRTISLARPQRRHALTPAMLEHLAREIEGSSNARALVLEGTDDTFCSGFDLDIVAQDPGALPSLLRSLSHAARAMRALPAPVVVAVTGLAIAGGAALAAAADFLITHDDARLGYPVLRLGISPAVSSPQLLPAMGAGPARARLLDTELISGRRALELGLAHECLERPESVRPRAHQLAADLAAKPHETLALTKRWMNELDASIHPPTIERALNASLHLVGSSEQTRILAHALNAQRTRQP